MQFLEDWTNSASPPSVVPATGSVSAMLTLRLILMIDVDTDIDTEFLYPL